MVGEALNPALMRIHYSFVVGRMIREIEHGALANFRTGAGRKGIHVHGSGSRSRRSTFTPAWKAP